MQAQMVLIPAESKKLICRAIFDLAEFQEALEHGIVAIHPSSSTIFLYEMITGHMPEGLWVCGVIAPKGLAGSSEAVEMIRSRGPGAHDPLKVSKETWFFVKGVLQQQAPLGEILGQMTETDVYVKGCNAMDTAGNAGVLFGNPAGGGGTIGKVVIAQRKRNFHMILPIGMEKLIPGSIQSASKRAGFKKADMATGLPCGLIPVPGRKIDEADAMSLLFNVRATPIAAGGLHGAEGAVVLACEGEEEQIQKAFAGIVKIKGARLPVVNLPECPESHYPTFSFKKER